MYKIVHKFDILLHVRRDIKNEEHNSTNKYDKGDGNET